MVNDESSGRLLRIKLKAFGQLDSGLISREQAEKLSVIAQVGTGRIAPGVAAPLLGRDSKLAAYLAVDVLRQRFGG